jgi:hypothetical protein
MLSGALAQVPILLQPSLDDPCRPAPRAGVDALGGRRRTDDLDQQTRDSAGLAAYAASVARTSVRIEAAGVRPCSTVRAAASQRMRHMMSSGD